MKKLFVLLTILTLIVTLSTFAVCSAAETGAIGDLHYEISDDNKVTITAYYGHETAVTVPAEIQGCPVTTIGNMAFQHCAELESITLPATITQMNCDFYGCNNLKKIHVTDIDVWLAIDFESYSANPLYSGAELYVNGSLLTDLVIPESVTEIKANTFVGYKSLKSVTFHDKVTNVKGAAFSGCENIETVYIEDLKAWCEIDFDDVFASPLPYAEKIYVAGYDINGQLYIPEGTTKIKDITFWDVKSFRIVYIPSTVKEIGPMAFTGTSSLQEIDVQPMNTEFSSSQGVLFSKDGTRLICYPAGKTDETYMVSDSVTAIAHSAIRKTEHLKNVIIGDNVTSIGMVNFSECPVLERVTIGKSVQTIDQYAFYMSPSLKIIEAKNLDAFCQLTVGMESSPFQNGAALYYNGEPVTKLMIPETVTKIDSELFRKCTSIESIVIPVTTTEIGSGAFMSCANITDVWYTGTEEDRNNMQIKGNNAPLTDAVWHYDACSAGVEHTYTNDCDAECNVCQEARTVQHDFKWVVDLEETCGDNGIRHEECTSCHIIQSTNTPIEASGEHVYDDAEDSQCNVCKQTREAGHNFRWVVEKEATCGAPGSKYESCTLCEEIRSKGTEIPMLAHSMGQWVVTKEATCEVAGEETKECALCGKKEIKEIAALVHQFVASGASRQPTCTEDGADVQACTLCGKEKATTLKAEGHKYGEAIIVKEPTQAQKGLKKQTCTVCGQSKEEELSSLAEMEDSQNAPRDLIWILPVVGMLLAAGGIVFLIVMKKRSDKEKNAA